MNSGVLSSAARMLIRGLSRLLVAGLVIYCWLWWCWLRFPDHGPTAITWAGEEGPSVGVPGTDTARVYTLRTRDGRRISSDAGSSNYTFRLGQLIYWSATDGALAVLSVDGAQRWVTLKSGLPSGWEVNHLSPSPNGVILSTFDNDDVPFGASPAERCYAVDLSTGTTTLLDKYRDAASVAASPVVVGPGTIAAAGSRDTWRLIRTNGSSTVLLGQSQDVVDAWGYGQWDYDFLHDTACILDGNDVTMIDARNRRTAWSVGFPLLHAGGITLQPRQRQVWIEADCPFGMGHELLVFDYNGHFLYHGGVEPEMGPPIEPVTPTIRALFTRLPPP